MVHLAHPVITPAHQGFDLACVGVQSNQRALRFHVGHAFESLLLTRLCIHFFHAGRHVSQSGPNQGTFDVSHADTEFALVLAKTLFAYYARLRNIAEGKEGA